MKKEKLMFGLGALLMTTIVFLCRWLSTVLNWAGLGNALVLLIAGIIISLAIILWK